MAGRSLRVASWVLSVSTALASVSAVHAQTLALEYERLFANGCAGLGLTRDSSGHVSPGQVGSSLESYCSGVSPLSGIPADIFSSGWVDPLLLVGPSVTELATSLPDWRDRRVERRKSRASESSADSVDADNALFLGIHPGVNAVSRDKDYARTADSSPYSPGSNTNFGVVLGAQRWLSDEVLLTVSGGVREHGYGIATSAVWAPTDRAFGEARIHFDEVKKRTRREIEFASDSQGVWDGRGLDSLMSNPSRRLAGVDMAIGYDFPGALLSFGPRIGLAYARYEQSAYAEYSLHALELPTAVAFDSASEDSLSHRIGLNVALTGAEGRSIGPSLELSWIHEYLDVQRVVTGHLVEDQRNVPMAIVFVTPDRPRDSISARLTFGIAVASRVTVFATGEIRTDSRVHQANGLVGARGKF